MKLYPARQSKFVRGAILTKIEVPCPQCGTMATEDFVDEKNGRKEIMDSDFVRVFCHSDECGHVFALKPRYVVVNWEYYSRLENDLEIEDED